MVDGKREVTVGLAELTGGESDGSLVAFVGAVEDDGVKLAIPISAEQLPGIIGGLIEALQRIDDHKKMLAAVR